MPERDDSELRDQLRAYVDGVSAPVGAERARELGQRHVARRRRTVTAVIEVAAIAAVIGTIAIAATGGRTSHPAAPTTVAVARSTTSSAAPESSSTAAPLATTTTTVTARPATGPWGQMISGPDGVFAFRPSPAPQLVRLDAHGGVVAQASGLQMRDLRLDTAGLLFGTHHEANGEDGYEAVDARTMRVVLTGHVRRGLFTGLGTTLWTGSNGRLDQLHIAAGPTLTRGVSVSVPGAPLADLAIDPSGQRMYVLQWNDRQQSLLSVRSAIDGRLLVAAEVVGSGPGAGHIVAAANGVWMAQPTGMMGTLQRYSPDLVPQGASIEGSNGVTVRVAGAVVLVDRANTDNAVLCLDPDTATERGRVPGAPGELFATDGTRIYQSPFTGGIEVHTLPAPCRG